ncbi:GPI inositol-deacylase [Pleurostoma richardsiae]|uniref:GPI inositol-deacylase n=1 Tax=Pleurostoma richardsiae TaxID=41990 RepID=A0AA38RXP0_9PEZI|nr:GPI inositol-deacylase [Pleurostoma richardsiae]
MQRRSSGSSDDGDPPANVNVNPNPNARPGANSRATDSASNEPDTRPVVAGNQSPRKLDRRAGADPRPSSARSRRSGNFTWKLPHSRNGSIDKAALSTTEFAPASPGAGVGGGADDEEESDEMEKMPGSRSPGRRPRSRNPWAITILTLVVSLLGIAFLATILRSVATRQIDPKGCRMSYMRPSYAKLKDFDTEHTRFASKYSLYLYREQGIDDDTKLRGIPVLFVPGNAGSYKQVRPIAAEAANYFHDVLQQDEASMRAGIRSLDFFTVDFNEDFTAFHGQTMLDQAEYLNEAIRYILSLYLDPRMSRRHPDLPDPTSVIILGHSMGGIVARTMLIMPNYQSNSINTIITMSAPHSRPPVTFDSDIVKIYNDINDYWRQAYSQQWANNNPLWHVTLVSIAGGGLDTVVPSDYASVESIVPDTHGFTVFTSTIPTVWTSMDHQAILWCDQFRKVIARTLYDIVDVNRAAQTRPRAERMRVFKKRFLTGMEDIAEKTVPFKDPTTLLTLEDNSHAIIPQGERLVLRGLGSGAKPRAHLLPVPPPGSPDTKRFTLLTDQNLDAAGESGKLEVLFCSVFPLHPGQAGVLLPMKMDLSGDGTGSTRLACKNAASDMIQLPASTRSTRHPFFSPGEKELPPFSYLQYDLESVADHQFVAVVDKSVVPTAGFVVAEFSDQTEYHRTRHISLRRLLAFGMKLRLPSTRPMVTEIKVPSLQSSLLAYNLEIGSQACGDQAELFTPLVRQYLTEPYESKYFVNARHASISLHGVSPYIPPPLKRKSTEDGLSFEFWTDPTCDSGISVRLNVDILGSLGKLYMRYRTAFAAFPLLIVALVVRKQFRIYDTQGVFVSFSESLDMCLRQSIPLILASLTLLSLSMDNSRSRNSASFWHWRNATQTVIDFHQNDLLVGTQDPFFWFMVPLIGVVCVGACTVLNYVVLLLTQVLSTLYAGLSLRLPWTRQDGRRRGQLPAFMPTSPQRRLITTAILLFLVATFIPYQFAYLVACIVQLTTAVRAHRVASEMRSNANYNFYNYAHSILILMLWVLPINLPILIVWVRNLAVHWFTPFSSHHNVLSIMPFIVLVEAMTAGKMVPRVTSRLKHVTSMLLFTVAVYAAVYGVSFAYMLHYLVNLVALWLVVIHSTADSWSLAGLGALFEGNPEDRKGGKTP